MMMLTRMTEVTMTMAVILTAATTMETITVQSC